MLTLAPLFTDHAVFQRRSEIRVFGEADGEVTGSFAGQTASVHADGKFVLHFEAMEAGGPYTLKVRCGEDVAMADDIYVGDVIMVSGQSNMQLKISETGFVPQKDPTDPLCRVFHAPRLERTDDFDNSWNSLTGDNIGNWSAIGCHLGVLLREERKVPIGILAMYQGAAVIQSFLSPEANRLFRIPEEEKHPDHHYEVYESWNVPAKIYRTMLLPLIPFALSGVIWYQGESNTSVAEGRVYDKMLLKMMAEWRLLFRSPFMPFVIVQINDFDTPFSKEGWKEVQKAEERVSKADRHARLVKIADMGQHDLIHPTNKEEVTERIAEALKGLTH